MERIYLDNAATSWPKAPGVVAAMADYAENNGAPAGRSGYAEAVEAQRLVQDCRRRLAALLHAERAAEVAMAFNGTDALNMALHGLLRPGDHVVTTTLEHNSVLRPLRHWEQHHDVEVSCLAPAADGRVAAEQMLEVLRPETRLAIITHASNVTGVMQPAADWGEALQDRETLLLVDAAQTLGHVPLDVRALRADVLAASTHKGVRGPLGTGVLYVGPRAGEQLRPWRQGGTGTQSETPEQPLEMPERLESGNLNMVGIAGLAAALRALGGADGIENAALQESELTKRLLEGLRSVDGCTIHDGVSGNADPQRTGVVSVAVDGFEPQELASLLDVSFRVQTRAGLHCAPLAHRELGTLAGGGTLRFSLGPQNTAAQVDAAVDALRAVTSLS